MLANLSKPVAIVTGVTGQDGILISEILLREGYKVIGLTRSIESAIKKFKKNKILDEIQIVETQYTSKSIIAILDSIKPNLLINLAGQSFVSKSWEMLQETIESQGIITANILDAILKLKLEKVKFINSTSSEIFDYEITPPYNEKSKRGPYNPYGCAQILSASLVDVFRERYGLFSCNAILFPHESIYRDKNFFFLKMIVGIKEICLGKNNFLEVGNLNTVRDWGSAKEYMEGLYSMTLLKEPEDFCFATNKPYSVEEILEIMFTLKKLNYKNYIIQSENLKRYYEPRLVYGDSSKAKKMLNWKPTLWGEDLVKYLMASMP